MQLAGKPMRKRTGMRDGGLDSVKELLRLKTDEVVGVVPRNGCVHTQDNAFLWDIVH